MSTAPPFREALFLVKETDSDICMLAPSPMYRAPPMPPALPEKEQDPPAMYACEQCEHCVN